MPRRATTSRSPRARQSPRIAWPVAVLAGLAVAVAGATAVQELVRGDDDERAEAPPESAPIERVGSTETKGSMGAPPLSHDGDGLGEVYRVSYRVATPSSVSIESWTLRRPFDARVVVYEGTSADGPVAETREQSLGVYATKRAADAAVVLAPAPSPVNYLPGSIVADAVAAGVLVPREQRVVADRPCQTYRTGTEAGGATFTAPESTAPDYVDVCIDGDGLLLELLETYQGRVLRQRVALHVESQVGGVDADDLARLPTDQTVPAAKGGGSVRAMDPSSQPVGRFLVLDAPPPGFTLAGRYEVIPPQPAIVQEETRGQVLAATSDIYRRGTDVLVVERGARLDTDAPWVASDRYPDVEVGGVVGTAELLAGTNGGELRGLLGGGRFVRVYGTVGLDELKAVVGSLRDVDGGTGPRYL